MNIIEFNPGQKTDIAFCFVDNTRTYQSSIREFMKNQADGTLANVYAKKWTIYQWIDEDSLLGHACDQGHKWAVVFSTGTEFIHGNAFFDAVQSMVKKDFFIAGHVLDRSEAYYELHHQCYIINLEKYKELGRPAVGNQELGSKHIQYIPERSNDNIHDDYTPLTVTHGNYAREEYQHKCHGWNILSVAFDNKETVLIFDETIRSNKKHFYPESPKDFYKNLSWAYHKLNYCRNTFVHTSTTETIDLPIKQYKQIVIPASGVWFTNYLASDTTVIMYDYNQASLDYWKTYHPEFKFVLCNLLDQDSLVDHIDTSITDTLINLSNIFNYEGTVFFYSLEYRAYKEAELKNAIKSVIPSAEVYSSLNAKLFDTIPTWHL